MRRTLSARAGVALVAIAFLITVNGPGALHHCPAHSPGAMATQVAAHHHGAHTQAPPRDGKVPHCTCAGLCCWGGPAAALPGMSPGLVTASAAAAAPSYRHAEPSGSAPHLLPFATGPPRSA